MLRLVFQLIALFAGLPAFAQGRSSGVGPPPHAVGPPAHAVGPPPRGVPEIDLFAGASVLMIVIIVGLLLWEWRRRSVHE